VPREADRREADAQPPEEASQDSVAILESQQFHHIAAAESKSNADAGPSRPFLDPAISTVSNRSEESPRSVSRSSEDLDRAISTESPDPLDEAHTRGWGYGEAMDVARGAEQRSSDGRTARRHSASLSPPQPYDLAFDNAVFNDGNGAHMLSPERDDIFETDFAQPVSAARSRSTLAIGRQTGVPHSSNLSHPHQPGYREPVNESFENGSPVGSPNVDQSPLEGLGRPMADAQPNRGTVSTTSTMQSFEFPNPQLAIAPQMRDYTGTPAVRSSFQRHSPPPGVPFPASTGHYKTAATSVTHGETTLSSGGSESPVLSSAAMPSEREVETNEDEPQEELEDDANPAPAYSTRTSTSLQLAQPRRPSRTDPPDVGSATTLTGVAPSNARLSPIITYSKKGRSSGTGQAAKRPFDTPAGRATKKAKGMAPVVPGTGNTADAPIDIGSDED